MNLKKLKGSIAILILALSWLSLYWLTGSRAPWQELQLANQDHVTVHLGDVPSENYDRMGFTRAVVRYTAAQQGWLVGTERGEITLVTNNGRQIWKRNMGIGQITAMTLNAVGTIAYVGEKSPAGKLYALDVANGATLWELQGADYVGTNTASRSHPSIVKVVLDKDGNVYALAYRFIMQKDGSRGHQCRLMVMTPQGQPLWQFPAQENMDSWSNWCTVNDANNRVVVSTSVYNHKERLKYTHTMYILDKTNGSLLHSIEVPPIPPFDNTVMRGSPNFSQDGQYLAAVCSDGRGMLFNKDGQMLWQRTISRPAEVDGSYINASGRDGLATEAGVLFTTINTFNRENWQLPTPVEHPGNNSIFMFKYDGSFGYQYRAAGTMEELALNGNAVACAVGRNVRTHNYAAHGVLVLDLPTGKELFKRHTEGPLQAIAIDDRGEYVAGVECPAVISSGKVLGQHVLHIWKIDAGEN